MKLKQKNE